MNKSQFTSLLNSIISNSPCNYPIKQKYRDQLVPYLQQTNLYYTKACREGLSIIPRMRKFGPISQKFLVLEEQGKEQIVAKSKLIESLYPTKSKLTPQAIHRSAVLAICRRLIDDQLQSFRLSVRAEIGRLAKAGQMLEARELNRCKLTGKSLNRCQTAVDHVKPFIQLVDEWLEANKLSFDAIAIKGRGNSKYFENAELMTNWQQYHSKNAKLQMACNKANASAGAKGYSPKHNG